MVDTSSASSANAERQYRLAPFVYNEELKRAIHRAVWDIVKPSDATRPQLEIRFPPKEIDIPEHLLEAARDAVNRVLAQHHEEGGYEALPWGDRLIIQTKDDEPPNAWRETIGPGNYDYVPKTSLPKRRNSPRPRKKDRGRDGPVPF